MPNFQIAIEKPEEIIPRLGKGEHHWKKGRSAFELSTAWMQVDGFPPSVRAALDSVDDWRDADLLEAMFERETRLPGRGRPSQTDLLALVRLKDGNAILGVEGKVDEPFGSRVKEWLGAAENLNRQERLAGLCSTLSIGSDATGELFYQLLHRTCSAVYEAKRFRCTRAIMLVHSFAPVPERPALPVCFEEFKAFSCAVGMPVADPGMISAAKLCDGIEVRLAWVSDTLSD
jgi:hypothetical protein